MSIHPIHTTAHIRQAYIRYLKTIKPFQDATLRAEFARAVEKEGLLLKGPYIEFTPPFKSGKTPDELVKEGILSSHFRVLGHPDGIPLERPLYLHQEEAIRKVRDGHNIVITTGTGSGKTEAFLIPILDALLREESAGTLKEPGVRALLLYPMNALANDQMERLRAYLQHYPGITFGRYVGETKHRYNEALDLYTRIHKDGNFPQPLPNELICRTDMQESPPHILLTNYAMLEYLLLRPEDSTLFDGETGKHWRFIVVDEAHSYDGAQATEIAMLLRRLQDRVTQGGQKTLQAIATSATLGEGEKSRPEIATFARDLFNLHFEPQDVILGQKVPESGLSEPWGSGSPELYAALDELAEAWRSRKSAKLPTSLPDVPADVLEEAHRLALTHTGRQTPRFLYEILKGDEHLHVLRSALQDAPLTLAQAAKQVFPTTDAETGQQALAHLVSAALLAREEKHTAALLPARYHVFARALEGAFVCLNTNHPAHREEGKPHLFLTRQKYCPHCGSRVFELANCTRCGASYLVGEERSGRSEATASEKAASEFEIDPQRQYLAQSSVVYESDMVARKVEYFILNLEASQEPDEDALIENQAEADEKADERVDAMELCPRCGAIYPKHQTYGRCTCGVPFISIGKVVMGKKHTLRRCVSCSTYNRGGVIYRFLTGQDAPVSVLTGTFYRDVAPSASTEEHQRPGEGRKMLVFTDSRQRAAFFAPYIQRSQERQLRRRLMVASLEHRPDTTPLRFSDWVDILYRETEKYTVFDPDETSWSKRLKIATWLMQEFSGLDRRLNLEGVGLLYFRPYRPVGWSLPPELLSPPWNFSPEEAYEVLAILLNTLRQQGAVSYTVDIFGTEINLLDSEQRQAFMPRAKEFYVRLHGAANRKFGIYSWLPAERYSNRRLDFLARLLARKKGEPRPSKETRQQSALLLEALWPALKPWLEEENKPRVGTVYRLRRDRWEVVPTLQDYASWYVCDTCQSLTTFNVNGVCSTYGCGGTLHPLEDRKHVIEDNLYRHQYRHEDPLPMIAKEHTAQWVSEKAAEIQNQFIRGEVNVLSCSTTFEMGVDVGDLNAVVLRNVPPSTANYVQRAGRAGRRTESVPLVLTFAQRRPHDLTFYAEPERMIAGKIRPPVVVLRNDKIIRRHLHSVVFAAFFRWAKKQCQNDICCEYRKCGDFFAPEKAAFCDGPALLRQYLETRPEDLAKALERIIPNDAKLRHRLELDNWGWIPYLVDSEEAVLDKSAAVILGELEEFRKIEEQKAGERKYKEANDAQRVQNTIRQRPLFGYLGSTNVLPKYGFPTDVVSLQTDHLHLPDAANIQLERDLKMAISEFAPGGQVVAAGKIWHSRGLKRLPEHTWEPHGYAVCPKCQRMNIQVGEQEPATCICGEPLQGARTHGIYITPEYGFLADDKTDTPGERPPNRLYASRVYLAHYQAGSEDVFSAAEAVPDPDFHAGIIVSKAYSRHASLAVVNNGYGQGFHVCPVCGYADVISFGRDSRKRKHKHRNPVTHQPCTGTLQSYHLGHRFMTDVLHIHFSMPLRTKEEIYSLLYAMLAGASEALGIPRDDVDGLIFYTEEQPSFLLFDTTPGGSGHVKIIHDNLRLALEAAYRRVDSCDGCAPETSCYACLRNYRNQFVHDSLQRGLAAQILAQVLGENRLYLRGF